MDKATRDTISRKDFNILKIKYKVNKLVKSKNTIFKDLPENHYSEIGKIVIRFQFLDNSVSDILERLLNLNPPTGLLVLENLSYKKKVTTVGSLFRIMASEWNSENKEKIDLKEWGIIINQLFKAEEIRNKMIHSIWATYNNKEAPVRLKPSYKKSGYSLTREKFIINDLRLINKWFNDIDKVLHKYMNGIFSNQAFLDESHKSIHPNICVDRIKERKMEKS